MDSLGGMWASAVLGPDGFTYCLPCNARQVLRLSETGASELVGADFGEETWKWTAAVLGPKGTIWGIPGNAERVVCLNPSGHMELVGPVLEGTHKWHCAVLAPDGCIYAPPCDAGQVLRIDCARRHVALIGPLLGGVGKYCACAATQSHVYCPPNHARQVLSICLATKQVELIGPDLSFGGGGAYVSAVCGLDGVVHCPPFGAPRALRIAEDGVELYGPELPWMAHKWRAALLAPDGCVYAAPCNAGRVLRLGPGDDFALVGPELPCDPAPEGREKWRAVALAADGTIYAVPSHAKQILRIKTGAAALESPSFEELMAARQKALSEEEQNLKAEAQGNSEEEMEEDDEELDSDAEDLEDWPAEECDGVSLWGPIFEPKWARKNKFRALAAGATAETLVAPPYFCGQVLVVRLDSPEEEAVQMLGDPPPKPPKKVFVPIPDEDAD